MEEMNLIDDTSIEGGFNAEIKSYLMETAKWARFIAIVSIVMGGLLAIFSIFAGSILNTGGNMDMFPFSATLIAIVYLIMAGLIIAPNVFLLNFASKAIGALRSGSESELTVAFRNLKSYYKFIGILTAIMIGFYALIFIMTMLGGAAALF